MQPRACGFIAIGCVCLLVFVNPGLLWTHYGESPVNVVAYPVESPNENLSTIPYQGLPSAGQTIFDQARTAGGNTVVYGSGYQDPTFKPFYTNEYVVYQNTTYKVNFVVPPPKEPFWALKPVESLLCCLFGGLGRSLSGSGANESSLFIDFITSLSRLTSVRVSLTTRTSIGR